MPDRPTLRQFVLKVHSRCNLRCDHCYVYTQADQRWRTRPSLMSADTTDRFADRLADYAARHRLARVDVVLHGGEPLLAGPENLRRTITRLTSALGDSTTLHLTVQTNGLLLNESVLGLFREFGVGVGVSMDGDQVAHDRHRRGPGGRGSHDGVQAALARLTAEPNRHLFRGLLCTVDLRNPPLPTFDALRQFAPPRIDFLLPHANWTSPPPGRPALGTDVPGVDTPYANWLGTIFDRWYDEPDTGPGVRLFEAIIDCLLGGRSGVEGIGITPAPMVVVETDGALEHSDILSSTFEGAAFTGLHLSRNTFDDFAGLADPTSPPGRDGQPPTPCRTCRLQRVCGGGLPAHRYAGDGFDHRSVYCPDLYALIDRIRSRISADLAGLTTTLPFAG